MEMERVEGEGKNGERVDGEGKDGERGEGTVTHGTKPIDMFTVTPEVRSHQHTNSSIAMVTRSQGTVERVNSSRSVI